MKENVFEFTFYSKRRDVHSRHVSDVSESEEPRTFYLLCDPCRDGINMWNIKRSSWKVHIR